MVACFQIGAGRDPVSVLSQAGAADGMPVPLDLWQRIRQESSLGQRLRLQTLFEIKVDQVTMQPERLTVLSDSIFEYLACLVRLILQLQRQGITGNCDLANFVQVPRGWVDLPKLVGCLIGSSRQVDPTLLKLIEDCCQSDRMSRPESMQIVKGRLEVTFDKIAKTA